MKIFPVSLSDYMVYLDYKHLLGVLSLHFDFKLRFSINMFTLNWYTCTFRIYFRFTNFSLYQDIHNSCMLDFIYLSH